MTVSMMWQDKSPCERICVGEDRTLCLIKLEEETKAELKGEGLEGNG